VITARTLVEREPNYSFVTARLLMDQLRAEALGFLGVAKLATHADMTTHYPAALPVYIAKGVELELLDPVLQSFDLIRLGNALRSRQPQGITELADREIERGHRRHQDQAF
jgi:ribonucleoside-diphosphate reductase alpha chain